MKTRKFCPKCGQALTKSSTEAMPFNALHATKISMRLKLYVKKKN
ncbi:hypothetical protein [Bacteroides graminisolvens]|nr:hypothetical protein [Bacteroides graminisolvens]